MQQPLQKILVHIPTLWPKNSTPRQKKTFFNKNVHSGFIHSNPKLETKMSINKRMVKLWYNHKMESCPAIKKEWTTDIHINMNLKFQKHFVEQKNLDAREYSINRSFKNRLNYDNRDQNNCWGRGGGGLTAKACKTISQVVETIYIFIGMLVSLVDTLSKLSKCIVKICALYTLTKI